MGRDRFATPGDPTLRPDHPLRFQPGGYIGEPLRLRDGDSASLVRDFVITDIACILCRPLESPTTGYPMDGHGPVMELRLNGKPQLRGPFPIGPPRHALKIPIIAEAGSVISLSIEPDWEIVVFGRLP